MTLVLAFCCLKFLKNNPLCCDVLINVNRKKVYFLGTFKPSPSTWEVVTLPSRFEMLRSKCKLADRLWILLILYPSLFYPSKKTNERKEIVAFSLSFRQTGRKVYSTRISRTFFLICKSLPSIASCISHLFHLLTFGSYKMDDCFWTTNTDKKLNASRWCSTWCCCFTGNGKEMHQGSYNM